MANQDRLVYQEFGSSPAPLERSPARHEQHPRIQVSRKGRKGKTVTLITGLEGNLTDLTTLLKQLKNQCGTGGTLKEQDLEIQGDHGAKILQVLLNLGYKAKISGG